MDEKIASGSYINKTPIRKMESLVRKIEEERAAGKKSDLKPAKTYPESSSPLQNSEIRNALDTSREQETPPTDSKEVELATFYKNPSEGKGTPKPEKERKEIALDD